MAKRRAGGAARGSRGRSRGKGSPGVGFAQSGGKATTFQGTSGGGAYGNTSGGSRGQNVQDKGTFANGNRYKVRKTGGDNTTTRGVGQSILSPPDLVAKGNGIPNPKKRVLKPSGAARGRGGSTQ